METSAVVDDFETVFNDCVEMINTSDYKSKDDCSLFVYNHFNDSDYTIDDLNRYKNDRLDKISMLDLKRVKEIIHPINQVAECYLRGELLNKIAIESDASLINK